MITLTGPEEKLALLKNVIPDALVKEYKKVAKEGNDEKSMVFFNAQIQPIVEDYFKKCNSTKMQQGETVQWQHDVTKGLFIKRLSRRGVSLTSEL